MVEGGVDEGIVRNAGSDLPDLNDGEPYVLRFTTDVQRVKRIRKNGQLTGYSVEGVLRTALGGAKIPMRATFNTEGELQKMWLNP